MVDVGAVVVDPDFFGAGVFAGGLAVEEEDIVYSSEADPLFQHTDPSAHDYLLGHIPAC